MVDNINLLILIIFWEEGHKYGNKIVKRFVENKNI